MKVSYEKRGQILVEIEPIRYQLDHLQYRMDRAKVHKETVSLGNRILSNELEQDAGDEWNRVTSVVAYNASYMFYWGQMHGLIKALPVTAHTLSNPQQNRIDLKDEKKVNFWSTISYYLACN